MHMTLAEYAIRFPERGEPVPAQYAGQWIAWNMDRTAVVACGTDMCEVRSQALARGCTRPVLQKIPHAPFVRRR
jgi:hypothetical protein